MQTSTRTSWKGLFNLSKKEGQEIYNSANEKVPVKEIKIDKEGQNIKAIMIVVKNSNSLYTSEDSLFYYPDSIYCIKKTQKIKLLDEKKYEIKGLFH